jgi:DNA-binding response OmpR family regulator
MDKIYFFSKDEDNIETIKKVLSPMDFNFAIRSFSEKAGNIDEDTDLVIIDICDSDIKNDAFYKEFFKKLEGLKKPSIIVLNQGQLDLITFLINMSAAPDDIIFKNQLDKELVPRIKFILSKKYHPLSKESLVPVNGLVLNLEKYELSVDGKPVEITFKEYELLKLLIENKNKVFSRNKLLSSIWGYDFYGGSRTVDVHIRRLRMKLGAPYSDMLKTVRNVGYMFDSEN